jgi:integrase
MKAGKEHRVPLPDDAFDLIEKLPRLVGSDFILPAPRGGALSGMALTAVMRRMEVDAVPHGFRSTFRDWAGEQTNHPREVAEQALAHTLENKVEAAYRRGDLLAKRRNLMPDWADFLLSKEPSGAMARSKKRKSAAR